MVEPKDPGGSIGPEARPLAGATIATFGATVAVAALGLANVIVISRALGPEGRGDVVFLMTIAGLTAILFTLSVQEANANLAGLEPARRPALATNSLILALLLGAVAAAVLYGLGELVPALRADVATSLVRIALAAIPVLIFQNYLMLLVRADYAASIANIALVIAAVGNVAVNGVLALLDVITVETAITTWVATQAVATAVLAWYVHRRLAGFGRPDLELTRRSVGFGLKTHLAGVMAAGNYRLDQWFVGSIAGSRELGLYSVAVAWAEALFFLPTALVLVVRPNLVRASPSEARDRSALVTRVALVATLPLAIAMVIAAPVLCVSVLGEEFRGAVAQLQLLAPGAFGIVALKILGNALVAQRRPLLESAGIGVAFVVTVALDILLIPSNGGVGAAIASSLAYTTAGAVTGLLFLRALGGRPRDLVPRASDISVAQGNLRRGLRGLGDR